jgi:hypothetical protein
MRSGVRTRPGQTVILHKRQQSAVLETTSPPFVLVIGFVVGDWTPQTKVRCFPSEKTDYDYEHAHEHGNVKDWGGQIFPAFFA